MIPKQNDNQRLLVAQVRAYVVQRGDTLWGIGRKFNIDWRVIVRNNRLENPCLIRPGDLLVLE